MGEVSDLNDPRHWLERAQQARKTAESINDPAPREAMLRIAEAYEQMAKRVQTRPFARARVEAPSLSTIRRRRNLKQNS